MGLLEELTAHLQAAGVGTLGADLFMGDLPDQPDGAMALLESPGQAPYFTHDGLRYERPGVQLLCRARSYSAGRARIEIAYRALASVTNQEIQGARYVSIRAVSTPASLGRDENNRPEFSCSLQVERVPPD